MKRIFWKFPKAMALLSLPCAVWAGADPSHFDPCLAYKTTDLQLLDIEKSKKYEEGTVDDRLVNYAGHGISEVKDFLSCLQNLVLTDDAQSMAQLIHYPIRIASIGWVKSESQFLRQYQRILQSRVKDEIMRQRYDDLVVRAMIGSSNGLVWFSGRVSKTGNRTPIKIVAINP